MSHFSSSKECIRNGGKNVKKTKRKKKDKTSPRPSFDQHYNLITCIPKRAFIWDFSLTRLISSTARWIQREVSKVCVGGGNGSCSVKVEIDVNDNVHVSIRTERAKLMTKYTPIKWLFNSWIVDLNCFCSLNICFLKMNGLKWCIDFLLFPLLEFQYDTVFIKTPHNVLIHSFLFDFCT